MILKGLRIENFRSYEMAVIQFSEGQNYFFGKNWQGKSSIMDAIGYALFGRTLFPTRIAGAPVRVENLHREGASEGSVELVFEHGGKTYNLERRCPGNRVNFTCDGKVLGESISTVKEAVFEKFGLDSKLFANVFYAEQDDLRKILESNPEDRKLFVETLFGFDFLKGVEMAAKHSSDELSGFADEVSGGNIKTIIQMIDDLRKQVKEKSDYVQKLERQVTEGKKDIESLKGSEKAMSVSQRKTETLQDKITGFSTQIDINKDLSASISTGRCPTCRQPIPKDLQLKLIHELKDTISELQSKLAVVAKDHTVAEGEWRQAGGDNEKFLKVDERLFNLGESLDQNQTELRGLSKSLADYEKQYKAFANKKRVIQAIADERDFLERFQQTIGFFRDVLRKNITGDLENGVNYFMSQFSDNDFDAKLSINDDFAFQVILHGRSSPIFNMSGAARDILALGVRYGLYRIAARDVDFILFDEPTRHMDSSNTLKLKQIFNEMRNQQIIVITVHDEFFDAEGRKFMIEKDSNLLSTIHEI